MGRDRNKLTLSQNGRKSKKNKETGKDPERTEVEMERKRGKMVDFPIPLSPPQFKRMVSKRHFL